jgi:hypothetical protein
LGALHEREAVSLRSAAFQRLGRSEALGDDALFVRKSSPLLVSGSCSGFWECCTSAEL